MNFLTRKTFTRFQTYVSDFMNSIYLKYPVVSLEYQVAGHFRPNYEEDLHESPNSAFDEVILRMAAPKSKVKSHMKKILAQMATTIDDITNS